MDSTNDETARLDFVHKDFRSQWYIPAIEQAQTTRPAWSLVLLIAAKMTVKAGRNASSGLRRWQF
jgi:hypothetical protein